MTLAIGFPPIGLVSCNAHTVVGWLLVYLPHWALSCRMGETLSLIPECPGSQIP